jgi:selenocysteine lyase/cysteine desulfurase
VEFLASLSSGTSRRERLAASFAALHERGQALVAQLWDGLADTPGVTLHGPPPTKRRTPTVAFTVEGRSSDEVATALAGKGVFVSNGDFYATTVVARLGLTSAGLVRAGCACYTTSQEVERLLEGVRRLVRPAASTRA